PAHSAQAGRPRTSLSLYLKDLSPAHVSGRSAVSPPNLSRSLCPPALRARRASRRATNLRAKLFGSSRASSASSSISSSAGATSEPAILGPHALHTLTA